MNCQACGAPLKGFADSLVERVEGEKKICCADTKACRERREAQFGIAPRCAGPVVDISTRKKA